MITAENVQGLREKTGAGLMDCKKALQDSDGDVERAIVILRKMGLNDMSAREGKPASEGYIGSYNHGGKIAVLVEVNCETDFVAKTDEFQEFANNVAMHIVATNPMTVSEQELTEKHAEFLIKEKEFYLEDLKAQGKPESMFDKIIVGKLKKLASEVCLMNQKYVKDADKTIANLLEELAMKVGEKVVIKRFVRLKVG